MIKANKDSEAGKMPSEQLLSEMMTFNEELVKKGIMLGAEGLHPSSKGAKVRFSKGKFTVKDGPFTETKEIVAGYWIWKLNSLKEAVEWVKRIPNPDHSNFEIEIREIGDSEELVETLSPELREKGRKLREKTKH
jgi:hypothetical protein